MTSRILYVDQGATFGGSIVVAGLLVAHLDPVAFSASAAIPFEDEFTAQVFRGLVKIHRRRSLLPYNRMEALREKIDTRCPRAMRRVAHATLSILDLLASTRYCLDLALLIVRERIRIVHVNNSIEALAAGVLTRRAVVCHLHGDFGVPVPAVHRWLYRRCSAIVAISRYVRSSAIAAGVPDMRMEVIPNGTILVPPPGAKRAIRERWGIPEAAPLIALVGRVVDWKGHRQFVQAAVEVHRRHPAAHFMFVGGVSDGRPEFLDELLQMARCSGIGDQLHCTGYVSDVPAYIEASDIIVHSSIAPEPFGLVIIEGMAMSKPVIASTLGAGPEIITDGQDGLLVDPRQTAKLCRAICRLIEDRDYAAGLGNAARRTVESRFTADAMARDFERIYRRITSRRAGQGRVA
jgi:glycosyltransferase involved in cell wall biosynthesis